MSEPDPLNEALKEATLAVLLGSTTVATQTTTFDGQSQWGTVTIESAFVQRLRSKAMEGEFDELLRQAMTKVSADNVARAMENLLAQEFLAGLKKDTSWSHRQTGWLEAESKKIAIAACTAALSADEELLDTLRSKVGMQVDRNKVAISVQLSDPEVG